MNRRKIYNVAPMADPPEPKRPDYLSPHCQSGACSYCKERRRRARQAQTDALNAAAAPGMFWNTPIFPGSKWDLGPSAPDRWIKTHAPRDPKDVLGFWG